MIIHRGYKVPSEKYWIQIHELDYYKKHYWTWEIKCINGRQKAIGGMYDKKTCCINDAKALSDETGLEVRF